MSYALSTQKRKLNRILDSVSNASNTSLSFPSPQSNTPKSHLLLENDSPANKKARTGLADKSSLVSAEWLMQSRSLPHTAAPTPGPAAKKPHFVPWDRKAFLERLESFQDLSRWARYRYPDSINDAPWAKRGWRAVEENTVGCSSCSAEIAIVLPGTPPEVDSEGKELSGLEMRDWEAAAQEQLIQKYEEMIITGHREGCPWREKSCDETIHRLPLAHPTMALEALRNRYDSLNNLAAELPPKITTPEGFAIAAISTQFSLLARNLRKTPAPTQDSPSQPPKALRSLIEGSSAGKAKTLDNSTAAHPAESQESQAYQNINLKALTLALFGWQAEKDHPGKLEGITTCRACFRREGLWFYREGAADYDGNTKSFEPTDHREFCPWIHAFTQSGRRVSGGDPAEPDLPGWQILVKVVDTAYASKIRRGRDGVNSSADLVEQARASTSGAGHDADATNEDASVAGMDGTEDDAELEKKDNDIRARFKKLRKVFTVKRSKSTGKQNPDDKKTKSIA